MNQEDDKKEIALTEAQKVNAQKARPAARVSDVMEDLLNQPLLPALYLVATPIGHLADISLRALAILAKADFVAAEDTRHSRKLLQNYGISSEMISYHDHNGDQMRPKIIKMIKEGRSVALISDAGTPLISDPGYKLAKVVREAGLRVEVAPGASSVIAGLCLSGLPTDTFLFEGFLPAKQVARTKRLETLKTIQGSLVFFETAKRIEAVVKDALACLGDRDASVLRELTKVHEEVIEGKLSDLKSQLETRDLKGEIVFIIGPPLEAEITDEDINEALKNHLSEGASVRDSVSEVMTGMNLPKKRVYDLALKLKKELD
ncbi:16S rRNA (cytidine(1402)-2'-O)-methyltransferase [Hyphomicrobiales bacterium 4NK60-0047b]